MTYAHPIAGVAVLLLLGYVASLGFRMRSTRRGRATLAARHARLAPIAYWTVLATWLLGVGSTLWLREDLEPASTLHFRTGCALAVLLTGSALTARPMRRGAAATAREIHPWLGAAAVLLAAIHVVTGLRIMP